MVQLTKERVLIVLHYTQTGNTTAVQNAFRAMFPNRNPPPKTTILGNLAKKSNEGTNLNLNKFCFMLLIVRDISTLVLF